MKHLNGNIVCAIDTETTGLDPNLHEIWEIAVLPLDKNFMPRQDVIPFHVHIKPLYPENIDPEALKMNREAILKACDTGFDPSKAADLFEEWYDKSLNPPYNKFGSKRRQIIPLGQNYAFDQAFIQKWLGGQHTYNHYFHYSYRDTKAASLLLNDYIGLCEPGKLVPFSKNDLRWLATTLGVAGTTRWHTALDDAAACARVYREILTRKMIVL